MDCDALKVIKIETQSSSIYKIKIKYKNRLSQDCFFTSYFYKIGTLSSFKNPNPVDIYFIQ